MSNKKEIVKAAFVISNPLFWIVSIPVVGCIMAYTAVEKTADNVVKIWNSMEDKKKN